LSTRGGDWKLLDLLGLNADGTHRSSFTTDRGAERGYAYYEGYAMHEQEDAEYVPEPKDFGQAMLDDLLAESVDDEDQVYRLLTALGHAMATRELDATVRLWKKVTTDALKVRNVSKDKWGIYGCDAKWPNIDLSLLEFLALRVRQPQLLIAVLGPRVQGAGGAIVRSDGARTILSIDQSEIRKGVPAIIAAILSNMYYLRRTGKGYDADVEHDTHRWKVRTEKTLGSDDDPNNCRSDWMRALRLLCGCMKTQPLQNSLYCSYGEHGQTRYLPVSLLDLAVLASEDLQGPVQAVLELIAWPRSALLSAFRYALKPGTLRGNTMGDIASDLYCRLVTVGTAIGAPTVGVGGMASYKFLAEAWCDVYLNASWFDFADTLDLSEPGVNLPMGQMEGQHPPRCYSDLYLRMYRAHKDGSDPFAQHNRLVCAWEMVLSRVLAPTASGQAAGYVAKPAMLLRLLDLCKQEGVLGSLATSAQILVNAPYMFWDCYDDVVRSFCDDKDVAILPEHYEVAHTALKKVVFNGARGAFQSLLGALSRNEELAQRNRVDLGNSLVGRGHVMDAFVRKLCNFEAHAPTTLWRHMMSEEVREHMRREVLADLIKWLDAGDWTEANMHQALVTASDVRSAVAVQVLISPPYNVPLLDGDAFVRAVVDEVYAPAAPIAKATGEHWGKRPREEEAGEAAA